MSQYGAPPPSGEPGDDRTRVPGGGTPPAGDQTPAWERPTRGPAEPDPWDQPATPTSGQPAQPSPQVTQQQPAAPYQQPSQPAQGWDAAPPSYDQGYAQPYQQPYQQQGQQQGQQPGPWSSGSGSGSGAGGAAAAEAKGLVGALFDFSFSTFVTGKIVKIVYMLALVGLALGLLGWLVSAFATGQPLFIVFALIAGPIGFVVYLCFIRMTLELFLAITRMSEDIHVQVPDQRDRT